MLEKKSLRCLTKQISTLGKSEIIEIADCKSLHSEILYFSASTAILIPS